MSAHTKPKYRTKLIQENLKICGFLNDNNHKQIFLKNFIIVGVINKGIDEA